MNETKYAFITGATGGLGKAFVYALAKRGYALILTGRSEDKLLALKQELNVPVIVCPADLSKADERTALFEEIEKQGVKINWLPFDGTEEARTVAWRLEKAIQLILG